MAAANVYKVLRYINILCPKTLIFSSVTAYLDYPSFYTKNFINSIKIIVLNIINMCLWTIISRKISLT